MYLIVINEAPFPLSIMCDTLVAHQFSALIRNAFPSFCLVVVVVVVAVVVVDVLLFFGLKSFM